MKITNLMQAIGSHELTHVKNILEIFKNENADINQIDSHGKTALIFAIEENQFELVKLLVENGADINATSGAGATPLHIAAVTNATQILQYLLENDADKNAIDESFGFSALNFALMNEHYDSALLLIKAGVDVDYHSDKTSAPITIAAQSMRKLVPHLIDAGVDLNIIDDDENTPFANLVENNDIENVRLMLGMRDKFEMDLHGPTGSLPLSVSLVNLDGEITQLLLDVGAKLADESGSVLHTAASVSPLPVFEKILIETGKRAGSDIDLNDYFDVVNGMTLLACAVEGKNDEVIDYLIQNGAKVTGKKGQLFSPIERAIFRDSESIVKKLMQYGFNLNGSVEDDIVPAFIALKYDRVNLLRFILANGVKATIKNQDGLTLLEAAAKKKEKLVIDEDQNKLKEKLKEARVKATKTNLELFLSILSPAKKIEINLNACLAMQLCAAGVNPAALGKLLNIDLINSAELNEEFVKLAYKKLLDQRKLVKEADLSVNNYIRIIELMNDFQQRFPKEYFDQEVIKFSSLISIVDKLQSLLHTDILLNINSTNESDNKYLIRICDILSCAFLPNITSILNVVIRQCVKMNLSGLDKDKFKQIDEMNGKLSSLFVFFENVLLLNTGREWTDLLSGLLKVKNDLNDLKDHFRDFKRKFGLIYLEFLEKNEKPKKVANKKQKAKVKTKLETKINPVVKSASSAQGKKPNKPLEKMNNYSVEPRAETTAKSNEAVDVDSLIADQVVLPEQEIKSSVTKSEPKSKENTYQPLMRKIAMPAFFTDKFKYFSEINNVYLTGGALISYLRSLYDDNNEFSAVDFDFYGECRDLRILIDQSFEAQGRPGLYTHYQLHIDFNNIQKPMAKLYNKDLHHDLTITSLSLDANGVLYDPTGYGYLDVQNKLLRMMHPEQYLQEDPVRLFRIAKYMLRGFTLTPELNMAMEKWNIDEVPDVNRFLAYYHKCDKAIVGQLSGFNILEKIEKLELQRNLSQRSAVRFFGNRVDSQASSVSNVTFESNLDKKM